MAERHAMPGPSSVPSAAAAGGAAAAPTAPAASTDGTREVEELILAMESYHPIVCKHAANHFLSLLTRVSLSKPSPFCFFRRVLRRSPTR